MFTLDIPKVTKIYWGGVQVATAPTNKDKRSAMYGYVGQDLHDGRYATLVKSIGLVEVTKGENLGEVNIIKILKSREEMENQILNFFKDDKQLLILFEIEKGEKIALLEIPVNADTVDVIVDNSTHNTTNRRTGICLRDVKDYFWNLTKIGKIIRTYDASEFFAIAEKFKSEKANNGNYGEFLLSGKNSDIYDRYTYKPYDVSYTQDGKVKIAELKASLKTINKSLTAGASNTNFLSWVNLK